MKLHKSRVSLALATILTGGTVAALPGIASAAYVNPAGTGSALVFPYYTANGGWATLFNLTNVTDDFLAVKVRFREMENSRDVLDFNVVMSPQDVWTGWVANGPNGPRFFTKDSSCTSPILDEANDTRYADFTDVAYTGSSEDGGSDGIERAAEGHLEVFVMGRRPDGTGPEDANHAPGGDPEYPTAYWGDHAHLDCSIVDAGFEVNSGAAIFEQTAIPPSENCNAYDCPAAVNDPDDAIAGAPLARHDFMYLPADSSYAPLKGNVSYINTGRGVGAGSTALHIEGFGYDTNLVTAQEYPYFLEPTLASNTGLWDWGVEDVLETLGAQSLFNEWSVNENTGARTDWVMAFPEKYLHVDIADDLQAGVNLVRLADYGQQLGYCTKTLGKYSCDGQESADTLVGALENSGDLDDVLWPFSEPFTEGQSCDEVTFKLYDREENGVVSSGTSISPAPAVPPKSLCYETNVITFAGAPSVLNSRLAQTIDTSMLTSGASAGWMEVEFEDSCIGATKGEIEARDCQISGLPVAGFALKERDFGDPNKNYGQLMDHGYKRGEEL